MTSFCPYLCAFVSLVLPVTTSFPSLSFPFMSASVCLSRFCTFFIVVYCCLLFIVERCSAGGCSHDWWCSSGSQFSSPSTIGSHLFSRIVFLVTRLLIFCSSLS